MRLPTHQEVDRIVSATGANLLAVENFVDSLDATMPKWFHLKNLADDAAQYGWKSSTVEAVRMVIKSAYGAK